MGIKMIGIGKCLPERIITNDELAEYIDTTDEWIVERTGIHQRHVATTESSLDLAAAAAEEALEGIDKETIDLVIVATITPDHVTPSMAAEVKMKVGLPNAVAFDINAACSGFVYGLWIAESLMKGSAAEGSATNGMKRALVIGTERLSRVTNWIDRGTCILFGDGAGVAVLENDPGAKGILSTYIKNYDDVKDVIHCRANYVSPPFHEDDETPVPLYLNGRAVFKFAVNAMEEVTVGALEKIGKTLDDVDWFVPHQANGRIIHAAAHKMGQPLDKFQISIAKSANVSSATVPMALYDLQRSGKLKKGDIVACMGFGGGLCAAGAIIEW
ncbi:MAG: beta-ketoacyl-ACP synthase III [Bacillota bacterium]|nr:beta-ketoacyl-ACP synthase III [Bacillota bacterium]